MAFSGAVLALLSLSPRHCHCCRKRPKTQHTADEGRGAHCKQEWRHQAAILHKQGMRHRPSGDPLHYCRQDSDSQLFTSWISPGQEARPFHICSRKIEMDTGRSVSRAFQRQSAGS